MRNLMKGVVGVVTLCLASACLADIPPSIDFYSNGLIQDGNVFLVVRTFENATVDMTGGIIKTRLELYDYSVFNVFGGTIEGPDIVLYDSTILNLWELSQTDFIFNRLMTYDTTTAKINIYGFGFEYANSWLEGHWASGDSFTFYIRDENTYNSISLHEIPEPGTIVMLIFGVLGFANKNR